MVSYSPDLFSRLIIAPELVLWVLMKNLKCIIRINLKYLTLIDTRQCPDNGLRLVVDER